MVKKAEKYLGYQIKVAQHTLHLRMDEVLRPFDLTPAQYVVLLSLKENPDQTNADLAARAFITPQSMQGVLAKMERAKLVERRLDPHHGRRLLTCLTGKGEAITAQAEKVVDRIEVALRHAVLPASPETVMDLLNRLNEAMRHYSI